MAKVIISPKYQVVIPKEVRSKTRLKKGQEMTVLAKGDVIYLVPVVSIKHYRGIAKGSRHSDIREKKDRI